MPPEPPPSFRRAALVLAATLAGCSGTCRGSSAAVGAGDGDATAPAATAASVSSAGEPTAPRADGPRLLAPMSGAVTTTRRPTLRWHLPEGAAGATVEVCPDRACTHADSVVEVRGTS